MQSIVQRTYYELRKEFVGFRNNSIYGQVCYNLNRANSTITNYLIQNFILVGLSIESDYSGIERDASSVHWSVCTGA
jgi:hypothetical protein